MVVFLLEEPQAAVATRVVAGLIQVDEHSRVSERAIATIAERSYRRITAAVS